MKTLLKDHLKEEDREEIEAILKLPPTKENYTFKTKVTLSTTVNINRVREHFSLHPYFLKNGDQITPERAYILTNNSD